MECFLYLKIFWILVRKCHFTIFSNVRSSTDKLICFLLSFCLSQDYSLHPFGTVSLIQDRKYPIRFPRPSICMCVVVQDTTSEDRISSHYIKLFTRTYIDLPRENSPAKKKQNSSIIYKVLQLKNLENCKLAF